MAEEARLGRESIETAYALKQLVTAGVRLFFYLEDRERTLDSPTDKIMLSLTAFADEQERDRARQRTYDAMARKTRAGHVTGGRVFGYDNVEVFAPNGRQSHVEREINEVESAVVRRIFELASLGIGFTSIAKRLNEEQASCPRAQRGRPSGWAPSSVREVLFRPLYRGEVIWNKSRKRDSWGQKRQHERPTGDWIQVPAPHLRIISEDRWQLAHRQMTTQRERYAQSPRGSAPWSREARYLLTGLLRCDVCGAGLEARSRSHGQRRVVFYGCAAFHRRGRSICANSLTVPMAQADDAVLSTLEESLLHPRVIDEAVKRAVARLTTAPSEDRGQLGADIARLDDELARLAEAIAAGGDAPALLAALRTRQAERGRLIVRLPSPQERLDLDPSAVTADLRERLSEWRSVLHEHPAQARGLLKQLIVGRLTMTPHREGGFYEFRGTGTLLPLITGVVPQSVASLTGFEPVLPP